jgi:hypothetical protein
MMVRAFGLACSLLVVDPLPAQVVLSPSEVQITSTAGLVNVTSATGTKITDLQVPTASGEKPITAMHRPGAVIETGPDSQATVSIPGAGSMLLGAETQVRLPKTGDKAQSLELLKGKLFLNISAEEVKKRGDASFRLKTPAALLAVKGTKFFASVENASETCGVHEGIIGSYPIASGLLNEVQAGYALSVFKGKPPAIRRLTEKERREEINYQLAVAEGRFTNSLGMKFAPVPGTNALFCIHETRNSDFAPFVSAMESTDKKVPRIRGEPDLPVEGIEIATALDFCRWLEETEKGVISYRLPTDEEWSYAVGIGRRESVLLPLAKKDLHLLLDGKIRAFPWMGSWPPGYRVGNYYDESASIDPFTGRRRRVTQPYLTGYTDNYPGLAPVMSFRPNRFGLFDLGGNVLEWVYIQPEVEDRGITVGPPGAKKSPLTTTARGGDWSSGTLDAILSSKRFRVETSGFRVVIVIDGIMDRRIK